MLNTDVEDEFFKADTKPKRKRVRKRTPKKVVKKEEGEAEEENNDEKEAGKDGEGEDGGKHYYYTFKVHLIYVPSSFTSGIGTH